MPELSQVSKMLSRIYIIVQELQNFSLLAIKWHSAGMVASPQEEGVLVDN